MIQLDTAIALLGYITVVSVAAERLVEMCKPVVARIVAEKDTKFAYYAIAAVAGGTLHLMSGQTFPYFGTPVSAAVVMGLLASGGSGVWHDMLGILRGFSSGIPPAPTAK